MTLAQLTRKSGNAKTGPIAVSMSSRSTCPDACSFKGNGCYADGWPSVVHWKAVDNGRGVDWTRFCQAVAKLPSGEIWRHNSAGDLPGENDRIDGDALSELVNANSAACAHGFTYTHKPVTWTALHRAAAVKGRQITSDDISLMRSNRAAIADATFRGFTVNVSHDSLEELDRSGLQAFPAVVVLPMLERGEREPKVVRSPAGNRVVVCPAQYRETTCAECKLCQRADRNYAIGFRAHGYARRKVSNTVNGKVSLNVLRG
jgi:hypothetical protein